MTHNSKIAFLTGQAKKEIMLKKLISWLKEQFLVSLTPKKIWDGQFVPTNIEKIDTEKGFSALGAASGRAGLPLASDTNPDNGHTEIFNYCEQLLLELAANAQAKLDAYRSALFSQGYGQFQDEIKEMPQRLTAEIVHVKVQSQDATDNLHRKVQAAERDLQHFKEENQLVREPSYPESRWLYLCFPVLLLGFELVLNSYVLSYGQDGLKGGIKYAFYLTSINVLLSALLGWWLRQKNSRNPFIKLRGYLVLLLLFMYVPFNLFVGHFRDKSLALSNLEGMSLEQVLSKQGSLYHDALHSTLTSPFSLESIESWVLFIAGIVFAVFAAADGYKIDDPYPGYSNIHRRVTSLRQDLAESREDFIENLDTVYQSMKAELDAKVKQLEDMNTRNRRYFELAKSLLKNYDMQAKDFQNACQTLISRYRAENLRARTSAAPAYFSRPPKRPDIPEIDVKLPALIQLEEKTMKLAEATAGKILQSRASFEAVWQAESQSHPGSRVAVETVG